MEVIRGLHNLRPRHHGCVATIGNFDGVHRGHKALLAHLCEEGAQRGLPTTLITFEPQPREFFQGREVPARLTRFREKIGLLAQEGVERVLCLPFNERLAGMPATEVIERVFVRGLGVRYLMVGDDFRFGRGREGDFTLLQAAGEEHDFQVSRMSTLAEASERISSTRVRQALAAGDLELAERLLGHRYFITSRVVYGRQLGRTLGVPTVNLPLKRYHAALEGVFAVEVSGLGPVRQGVANIGVRPTVDGREPLLEVHLFDVDEDLYGRLLTVTFRHKIRDEWKFDSLDALKARIDVDIDEAGAFFAAEQPA